jgi:CRISPR-associated endonuclease/helicase Cas3
VKTLSSFSRSFSHPNELLTDHLSQVSEAASENAGDTTDRIETAARLMGLLHDVGKATIWFQNRITGLTTVKDFRSHHAQLSAIFANHIISSLNIPDDCRTWLKYAVVTGIAKHHVNIGENPKDIMNNMKLTLKQDCVFQEQLSSFSFEDLEDWLESQLANYDFRFKLELNSENVLKIFEKTRTSLENPIQNEQDGIEFLIAWGCLLGADKISAALPNWTPNQYAINPDIIEKFKKSKFSGDRSEMGILRNQIFNEIQDSIKSHPKLNFYTITAPTGSGKTLAGFAAGLLLKQEKQKKGPSKLIYCLPFTSIIDQNSSVYKQVLESAFKRIDTDMLLTHHHLTDLAYKIDDEYVEDGGDLLVETWQSEIVVTTFHQLLYTLFSSKNKMLKRIPALKNAVVILDEVQAIPHKYWDDIYTMFQHISRLMNTTFVLMTATMPLIIPSDKAHELLPSHSNYYRNLARTTINSNIDTTVSIENLTEDIECQIDKKFNISRIIILNRRGLVRDLYEKLEKRTNNLHMLSTDFTPKDRMQIIKNMNKPFTLISTQVIEAGVDISAHEVWRDIAPLDSIIQSAGRCNRNSETKIGPVNLFKLELNGKLAATPPYDSFLIATTEEALSKYGNHIREEYYYCLSQDYYRLLKNRSEQSNIMCHFATGDFHKLSGDEGLKLIDELPRQSYFIIQDEQDEEIWNKYLQINNEDAIKRKSLFKAIKREFTERIVSQIDRNATNEIIPLYPDDNRYSSKTGLRPGQLGYEII